MTILQVPQVRQILPLLISREAFLVYAVYAILCEWIDISKKSIENLVEGRTGEMEAYHEIQHRLKPSSPSTSWSLAVSPRFRDCLLRHSWFLSVTSPPAPVSTKVQWCRYEIIVRVGDRDGFILYQCYLLPCLHYGEPDSLSYISCQWMGWLRTHQYLKRTWSLYHLQVTFGCPSMMMDRICCTQKYVFCWRGASNRSVR